MFGDIDRVAQESLLELHSERGYWAYNEEHPHITSFAYTLRRYDEKPRRSVGNVDGYRIRHDWVVESDTAIWDEADALDADVVTYVEALIREFRVCDHVFGVAPTLASFQSVTILRHVEAKPGADSGELLRDTTACLAVMDAPSLMLVDPWPMPTERRAARGKVKGRSHVAQLLKLGFSRMLGSRFAQIPMAKCGRGPTRRNYRCCRGRGRQRDPNDRR